MKIYENKIVLKMKNIESGNIAKSFWDSVELGITDKKLKPFMLFWVSIDKK